MSDRETHDITPTLAQAFDAFNRSADKLSKAYRQLKAKDHGQSLQNNDLCSSPLLLGALECVATSFWKNHEQNGEYGDIQRPRSGIIVVDRAFRAVIFNTTAQELTGLGTGDITSDLCRDVFEETLNTGKPGCCRMHASPDVEVVIYTSPVSDDSGGILGAVGIINDLAEQNERQAKIPPLAAQSRWPRISMQNAPAPDLTPMLTAIGDIIVNITHRIRSPLSAIQLFAELLKQDLGENNKGMVEDIIVGVHSLDAVLCNLLSFAQPVSPHFRKVDLTAVLDESLLFAAPAIKQKGISLVKGYSHELYCHGDLEQLKQVCFNLILNAIQAMPDGGELGVKASYTETAGDYVSVEVTDNGCGIAGELMHRIFTPFFTTKEDAAGLGLCIVYKVMEAHHGSIQIKSVEGDGTVASIQIPVEQETRQVVPP